MRDTSLGRRRSVFDGSGGKVEVIEGDESRGDDV